VRGRLQFCIGAEHKQVLERRKLVIARAEREEKLLAQEFGGDWQFYASNVTNWFPGL